MTDRALADRLNQAWHMISQFTIRQRKHLVLLCRAQEVIIDDSYNLLCIQTNLTQTSFKMSDTSYARFFNFVVHHKDLITSPIASSILLDICRSAPMGRLDIKDAKLASWAKEISICESPDVFPRFRYDCWFYPDCFNIPLLADVPANPQMAKTIHDALVRWRDRVCNSVLYPRMSTKQISHATVRQYEAIFDREWVTEESEGGVEMTQETLERIYHEFGIEVPGPCEIRQKWYQSGVAPRSYFASGGTGYQKSKFIQEPAGWLTAELPTTHPIMRLNPARVRLRDSHSYLRIYDLSGFTSNHWECKRFLDQLALWCSGYTTTIVDATEGLVEIDLGHLISDYNQSMNYLPEYSLERVCDEFAEVLEFHNRAGFLGVYGNINFSTFVHGASLLMVVRSTDEANVAGDDAHYVDEPGREDVADRIIDANGYLEPTKVFRSDQIGAVCLKRGLIQDNEVILPKVMLVFPSFSNLGRLFGYNAPQFPYKSTTGKQKLSLVGTELFRFLRGAFLAGIEDDLTIAIDIIRAIYESASLPKQGSLPPYEDILIPVCPNLPSDILQSSPLDILLRYHFSDAVILPRYLESGELDESKDPPLFDDGSWVGTVTRKLKYLEVLEYVVKEEMSEILYGLRAYERIRDVFENRGSKVYSYRCIRPIPDFLLALPN